MEYKRTDDKEGGVQHPHVDGQLQVGNVKLETVKLNLQRMNICTAHMEMLTNTYLGFVPRMLKICKLTSYNLLCKSYIKSLSICWPNFHQTIKTRRKSFSIINTPPLTPFKFHKQNSKEAQMCAAGCEGGIL